MFFKKDRKNLFGGCIKTFIVILFLSFMSSCNDIGFDEKLETILKKYGDNPELVIEQFEFIADDNIDSYLTINRMGYFVDDHYIEVIVPEGTDITYLVPSITFYGGDINNYDPEERPGFDFTNEVYFGTPEEPELYQVRVIVAPYGDNLNGTVEVSGYTFMKCTIGQFYRPLQNDCRGTGDAGSNWGAIKKQFCDSTIIGDCGTSDILDASFTGNASKPSEVWEACANLIDFGGGWTVPTETDLGMINTGTFPYIDTLLFPDTPADIFWTATYNSASYYVSTINFSNGSIYSEGDQTLLHYVRCMK